MNTPTPARRPKSPATVAPSKIVSALNTKLSAAQCKVFDLQQAEQPRVDGTSHHDLVVHFLKAAWGVYPVATTFHEDWMQGGDFGAWARTWEQSLTADELALWHYMQDQRDWGTVTGLPPRHKRKESGGVSSREVLPRKVGYDDIERSRPGISEQPHRCAVRKLQHG